MDAVEPWRTPGIRSEVPPSVRPMNQGQDESATRKSTVRNRKRPPCLTALERRKKKSCQVPKDESTIKARVTNWEEHLCLQGSNMIESRRNRVPEVRDSSRRGSRMAILGCVFPREIKKRPVHNSFQDVHVILWRASREPVSVRRQPSRHTHSSWWFSKLHELPRMNSSRAWCLCQAWTDADKWPVPRVRTWHIIIICKESINHPMVYCALSQNGL